MSSSNPIAKYGSEKFTKQAISKGVDGLIVPDVPLEEFDEFFGNKFNGLDKILLTTPTSSKKRIQEIDEKSSGFVYCVSVVGTTGVRDKFDTYVFENLKRTYSTVEKNKMQIGFGISSAEDVRTFSPFCDGVIVGSAVIKSIMDDDKNFMGTLKLIEELKSGCKK
jgi:tryptophan synthase alpha chain